MSVDFSLNTLEMSGLIRRAQLEPELEYLFRHALVQDAAYDSLLKTDRRNIHLLTGKIMEAHYSDRLDELAPELARHFQEAGDHASAASYYIQAGQRALNRFANVEAADYFRSAIQLYPDKRSDVFVDLQMNLGAACFVLGHQTESVAAYITAAQIAREVGAINKAATSYHLGSRSYFYAGDFQNQYQTAYDGYQLLKDYPVSAEIVSLIRSLAGACYFNGMSEQAIEYAMKALEMARGTSDKGLQSATLVTFGTVLPLNESTKKVAAMGEAAKFALEYVTEISIEPAIFNYAEASFFINGDWKTSVKLFRESILRTQQKNFILAELWHTTGLQKVLSIMANFEEADLFNERVGELLALVPDRGTVEGTLAIIKAIRFHYNDEQPKAISILQSGLGAAIKNNDQQLINEMGVWLSEAYIAEQKFKEAADVLLKAISAGDRNLMWGGVIPRSSLASVQAKLGNLPLARQTLLEAQKRSKPDPGRMTRYTLALSSARIAASENDLQTAIDSYDQACSIAREMELNWYYNKALLERNQLRGAS